MTMAAPSLSSSLSSIARLVLSTSMVSSPEDGTWMLGMSPACGPPSASRSEEHTSELQSLMRISYAVFCLKKKKNITNERHKQQHKTSQQQTYDRHQTHLTCIDTI